MPPCFIVRISRSSSGLVTEGPNHHQRIMIRESSGGFWKERCRVARSAPGKAHDSARRKRGRMGGRLKVDTSGIVEDSQVWSAAGRTVLECKTYGARCRVAIPRNGGLLSHDCEHGTPRARATSARSACYK